MGSFTFREIWLLNLSNKNVSKIISREVVKVICSPKLCHYSTSAETCISFEMEWIPRSQNDLADFLSSICNTDDWGLSPLSCHLIDSVWEPNYKDRFTNHANAILARCNSRNPGSECIDAFVINSTRGKTMLGRPSALFFFFAFCFICVIVRLRELLFFYCGILSLFGR